jgi:hypothetical protein
LSGSNGSNNRPKSDKAAIAAAIIALGLGVVNTIQIQANQNRTNQLNNQQTASKVYIGEEPPYAYTVHPKVDGEIRYVVMNTSASQVNDVWVEGKHGRYVKIWGVQGCTMYALPQRFIPVAVDYTDANGRWRNVFEGYPQEDGKPLPKKGDESSPWDMPAQNCS